MFDERTGTYKFIEMNGRFWGWHSLTFNAGLNFPLALYRMLQGVEVQRKQPKINATWVRLLTDGPTVAREAFRGRMSPMRFVNVLFSRTRDAVWSWQDPLPFLMEVAMTPYLLWKKGF
jgi:predicted ATP-grasp superfamily ATP-dependent carboligase